MRPVLNYHLTRKGKVILVSECAGDMFTLLQCMGGTYTIHGYNKYDSNLFFSMNISLHEICVSIRM